MSRKKESKEKEHHNDNGANRLMTGDTGSLYSSEWFGAIIRYVVFLGTRKFTSFYDDNPRNFWINALIGWIFKLVLIAGLIVLLVIFST